MATSVDVVRPQPGARMTADEFLHYRQPIDGTAELVHGEVRVSPFPGGPHSRIVRNVFRALDAHVQAHGLGEVFTDGTGYALPHRDDTVRGPDVSFVRAGRLPTDNLPEGWLRVAPDLVVEVLSPSERQADLMDKLDDYFAAGVRLAWVIDRRRRGVDVHTPDRVVRWLAEDAVLDGALVLPGLRLAVADLFKGAVPPRWPPDVLNTTPRP
jgi:Uma2 family endonuclease